MSGIKNKLVNQLEQKISKRTLSDTGLRPPVVTGAAPLISRRNSDIVLQRPFWIFSGKTAFNQLSKSTSSQKIRRKRDISSDPPQSEFLGTASTFSELGKVVPRLRELGTMTSVIASVIASGLGLAINTSNTYAAGSSITITTSGSVDLSLLRSDTEAVFGRSSEQTVNVNSNHYTGYTLTIAGSDNTGRLVGTSDSSKYLASISNALAESTFNTDTYNNKWGFLPNKLYNSSTGTTTNNNIYQPSPTQSTPTIIDRTNSPTESVGNDYKLAVAARVDSTQALDSYGQTFILAATGNGYDYHIGFTDDQQTLPPDQFGNTANSTVTISNIKPTKDGWVFQGWCTQATTNNGTTCPGGAANTYQPGASITLNADTGNDINLHAIWAKGYDTFEAAFAAAGKTKTNGYYTMQDMTPEICKSIVIGSPAITTEIAKNTLIDTRNNKTYLVAKYADGHCWMRENLNYAFTAGGTVVAYNFQTGQTFNYTTTYATQTSTGTAWSSDASDGPRSFQQNKDNCIGGTDINTSGGTGATCDANRPYERIGVLYNWAAATAQTGAQAATAGSSGEQVIPTSICPKGWRLPANSGNYSFSTLMGSYGLPTTSQGSLTSANNYSGQLQNPLNFNRPGYYGWSSGTNGYLGTNGRFWSSLGYSATSARGLAFYSTYFYPQDGSDKGYGYSVRCLAV